MKRNTVIDALEARIRQALDGVGGLKTWGEEPEADSGFAPERQPAGHLILGQESNTGDATSRPVWTLSGSLYLFAWGQNPRDARATMHDMLDAVEAALKRQPGEVGDRHPWTTLGGVVYSARPTGSDGGEIGQQSVHWMELELIVPG